jgi:hypothetical protein
MGAHPAMGRAYLRAAAKSALTQRPDGRHSATKNEPKLSIGTSYGSGWVIQNCPIP